ncbi:MAG TPA: hypothetical protein VGQ53_17355 [Chitinophagaceae bacterium]|jgi:hypothetical protein|nr:hypothetical protein [Chitinophagaceae bacterium]
MLSSLNTEKQKARLEIYNTIILAVATLCAAWCSYQGSLWNGIQTFRLADSNKYSRLAQQILIRSDQAKTMEETAIISFMDAVFDKDKKRVDYMLKGLRPELSKVLSDWMQADPFDDSTAPRNPMTMPGYLELMEKRTEESEKMSGKAAEAFDSGSKANLIADKYSFLTVMFSTVMFLSAITTKLVRPQAGLLLLIISALICVAVLLLTIFSMPVAHRG